jgi:hypothetical protein
MSLKVVEYDSKSHQEVKTLGDGFSNTRDANNCAYARNIPNNHFYKVEQSDTPVMQSYEDNNELDYSRNDFSVPLGEPRNQKYHVFWEGWGCLVVLAILIFLALAWQASGAPM